MDPNTAPEVADHPPPNHVVSPLTDDEGTKEFDRYAESRHVPGKEAINTSEKEKAPYYLHSPDVFTGENDSQPKRQRPWRWIAACAVIALCMLGVGIGIGFAIGKGEHKSSSSTSPSSTPSSTQSSTPSSTTSSGSFNAPPRTDGRCGPQFGGATCDPNGGYGGCCSSKGWCGTTPNHCLVSEGCLWGCTNSPGAVTSGTTGIAALSCNSSASNDHYMSTATSAHVVFSEACYTDYPAGNATWNATSSSDVVKNLGTFTVYTFQSCMDQCAIFNANKTENAGTTCEAVTYNANLTEVVDTAGGNCFLKSARGVDFNGGNTNYTLLASAYVM